MLLSELLISLLAGLFHPSAEGLTNLRVDDVADILSWHLSNLSHDGQAVCDVLEGESKVKDDIKRQIFILRNTDVLDLVSKDSL